MGNCFTNTATQNIVQITPRPPPPANGEHGKPPSTSPKPAPPKPSGPPPPPNPMLPGSSNPACGVVGWSTMDVWSLYILERELWSGQFWTTYLCTERATGLKCVCKSASKLPGAYVVGYMRREVAILQRLCGQPNVATFRAAFEDADRLHLVMEFCSGGELFDRRIAAKGGYSERQAAALCRDVLIVVHVCHSMGVMHRDLRPENFRLASSAEGAPLKAIDFGLSVFIEEGKVYKEIVGSAYYVAPEVLRGNYGREIDVWSAGVILYILLCGSPPFWAETEKGIFDAILVGQVDLRSNPWPTISENAKDLIRQMLNRDPHKRITAVQALEHPWLKEGGASDRPNDSAVLSRTKQLKEMNKLKQLDLKETAEDPAEEVKGLKQMFDNMDTDKSERITPEEQKTGLTKLGSKIGEAEVQKLMEAVDVDKSSNIDHMEFMPAMVNKDKLEKEEDLLPASQHLDKDNNRANGDKDESRASKRSKRSGRKNDKKEAEQPVKDNVVMEEVPSSQVEPDKKLEEELRKKMLAQKLAGGSGVNISGNNEQHVQDNNMQETGFGVGNTEREVNNYKYQDKNHVEVEDVTNHKQTQEIQGMNQDGVIDTNESTSGTSIGGIDRVKVNSTRGIAGTDKEYFADEARRKSGRTDTDQKMMDKPVERIKAKNLETVLEHPWLKEGGASDRPIDSAVPLRMKQFKEMNKLKQPALKETIEDPPEEVKDAKQMFDNVDKDKTRTITPEELKIGLTKLGLKIGKEEVDVDKSGSINGMEFLPGMVNKHKLEKEEEFVPASQHLGKDNNSAHGEKDVSRVDKRSKSSSRKNDKKEEEIELNKHVDDNNMVMEEVPSSQAELDKKLEEYSRKKMLSRKLASGSGVNGSGNSEKHIQHNNMQEIGVGVENTEREVNNYKYQDKSHVEVEDVTDDKHAQQMQYMNQDSVVDTNESASGTSTGGRDGEEVNSTQGIVGTDKENFGDEARRKSGRTDRDRSGDDGQGSGEEAKNLEAVPGENS